MAKRPARKPAKKGATRPAKKAQPTGPTVTIDLTPEQQAALAKATQGRFTAATFVFSKTKKIAAPEHRVTCKLARVADS